MIQSIINQLLIMIVPLTVCDDQVCDEIHLKPSDPKSLRTVCSNSSICNRDFSVSYIGNNEPYVSGNNESILYNVIKQCCGHCANITASKYFSHIGEFDPKSNDAPDFLFPVLAKAGTLKKYGYYFVPVYRLQSVMCITRRHPEVNLIGELLESCPLLFISFGLALMAGFIMWSLETWKNQEEFSRTFPIGWFQAIWYSFVSMTTVGYGDQVPKLATGKLFAIIWIYIGVILCSMITATITSSLLNQTTPPAPEIKGMRVGMIKHRDFEGYVTASLNGRKVVEVEGEGAFFQLLQKLKDYQIDGIIIERGAYYFINQGYKYRLRSNETTKEEEDYYIEYRKPLIDYLIHGTLVTERRYTGPELYYGILMKKREYNVNFGTMIRDNSVKIQRVIEERLVHIYYGNVSFESLHIMPPSTASALFSTNSYYFQTTAVTIISVNGVFVIIGIVYEVLRRKKMNMINKNLDHTNV